MASKRRRQTRQIVEKEIEHGRSPKAAERIARVSSQEQNATPDQTTNREEAAKAFDRKRTRSISPRAA